LLSEAGAVPRLADPVADHASEPEHVGGIVHPSTFAYP
jgi:hypothetical protein